MNELIHDQLRCHLVFLKYFAVSSCLLLVMLQQNASGVDHTRDVLPYLTLIIDTNEYPQPLVITYTNSSNCYAPTTQHDYWLSSLQISNLYISAVCSNDATAAYRLCAYYMLSRNDYVQELRWCAFTVYLGGVKEAMQTMEVYRTIDMTQEIVIAYSLTSKQISSLKEMVSTQKLPQAAFRLAIYYGIVLGDTEQQKKWLQESSSLGCNGAKEYLDYINSNAKKGRTGSGID